ncbi:MAG: DUF6666 family protein, partial [Planctomycetota bacterium]
MAEAPSNRLRDTPPGRIDLGHARPMQPKRPTKARARELVDADAATKTGGASSPDTRTRKSLVRMAAHGEVISELPPSGLDGSLVRQSSRRTASSRHRQVEAVGYFEDSSCGCRGACDCGMGEAGCGLEAMSIGASCGAESVYVEAGCGLETGMGPGCGLESCATCDGGLLHGGDVMYGGCDGTVGCGCGECGPRSVPVFLPILRINWCRFQFFGGVNAFTGPMNFVDSTASAGNFEDGSGSFGFYEGFNEGRSLKRWFGVDLAAQFGVRAVQANLHGAEFTNEQRNQVFVTWGLFRRVDYGLQYGTVVDYLNDDWYFQGDLIQTRSEISWKTGNCHEFGFQYTTWLHDHDSGTT